MYKVLLKLGYRYRKRVRLDNVIVWFRKCFRRSERVASGSNYKRTLEPTFKQQIFMIFTVEYIFQKKLEKKS